MLACMSTKNTKNMQKYTVPETTRLKKNAPTYRNICGHLHYMHTNTANNNLPPAKHNDADDGQQESDETKKDIYSVSTTTK